MTKRKNKDFDTVEFFRKVKKKITEETKDMTFNELQEYIKTHKLKREEIIVSDPEEKYNSKKDKA